MQGHSGRSKKGLVLPYNLSIFMMLKQDQNLSETHGHHLVPCHEFKSARVCALTKYYDITMKNHDKIERMAISVREF